MQSFSKNTLLTLGFCLIFSISNVFAQKNKTEPETKIEPVEVKSEPVEVKVEPSSPPTTNNDSPPSYEPTKSESSSNSESSSRSGNTDPDTPRTKPRTTIRNDIENRRRRAKQKDEIERQKREARRRNKKDKDNDDDYYVNCPTYDPYGECDENIYPNNNNSNNRSVNPYIYFDGNDVAYFNYLNYLERVSSKFMPFFDSNLSDKNKPLYGVGIVEAAPEVPYITPFWNFYYEPDLDNFYINFSRIKRFDKNGNSNFERLVIRAKGKTVKKVGKKFNYKGKVRPVIVEDISYLPINNNYNANLPADIIFTFNLSYLPKGKYELLLLSKDGHTVKLDFKLK